MGCVELWYADMQFGIVGERGLLESSSNNCAEVCGKGGIEEVSRQERIENPERTSSNSGACMSSP